MTFEERMEDLTELEESFNLIDLFTKYRIFFSDILSHREDMIEKDKKFLNEALKFIKPKFKKWPLMAFIICSGVLLLILSFTNKFSFVAYSGLNIYEIVCQLFQCVRSVWNDANNEVGVAALLSFVCIFIFSFVFLIWLGLFVYLIFQLISFPFSTSYYVNQKLKAKKYLRKLEDQLSYEYAKKQDAELVRLTEKIETIIQDLCEKHNIDERLQNRENIPFIKKQMNVNIKHNPTVKQVCDAIISKGLIQNTVDTQTWCELLLAYDGDFTYYQRENPWLKKYQKRKEKIQKAIWFIPSLPLRFFTIQIKFLFAMFGFSTEDLKKSQKIQTSFNPENQFKDFSSEYGDTEPDRKFTFFDPSGNYCESGGLFRDKRGNLCEWGSPFYDNRNNLCEWGNSFYDGRDNYCEWGNPFYDWSGNLINPRG